MDYARFARVEVDLEAVKGNLVSLKALTTPGTLFMAVVKADAYGHGALPVARAALASGADRLGVATIEEAIELREAGVRSELHVLSEPPLSSIPLVLEHDLIPAVTTREFGVGLGRQAAERGVEARFHLKVDTGMNRIGVAAEEAAEFAVSL
ncbi:alanine racemase, partial [bacterium]|nr:alanine racemase [bacterium]